MQSSTKKILHICIIITIIVAIIFTALILILRYGEKGEINVPFEISKVTIISTVDAQDIEDKNHIWNKNVCQNNDIYIDIKKNDNYLKKSIIEKVVVNNFEVIGKPQKGNIITYKPSTSELASFENKTDYEVSELVFNGEQSTDLQKLQISNQGGRIALRCSNNNIGTYISNDGKELNYNKLLKEIGIINDDIKAKMSFDLEIFLTDKKSFKTTVEIDIPTGDIVNEGKTSQEITNLDIVFKRNEN